MNQVVTKPDEKPSTRQGKRVRATRRRLLKAARELFAEKGIDLTTIDDITQRADVGKGTFYYHFTDKNEVIAELIRQVLSELIRLMEDRCAKAEDLPSLLESIIQVHIDFFSTRWEDFVLYYQGRADLKLKEGYSGLELPFIEYLESIETLVDSVVKQRLDKPLLRRIGCAVAGFLSGYYSFAVIASEDDDVDANLQSLRGILVSSMARFITGALRQEENNA
ncbi:MAG: TetR/AcrR family transcriptional regulator [bacterium]|nr:MAG: TetR/AcrR family transcriptional regulator [bacterium]